MDMEKLKKLAGLKTNGDYLKIIATDKKLHSDTPPSDDTQDELDSEITSFDDIDAEERNNADDVPKDSTDSSGIEHYELLHGNSLITFLLIWKWNSVLT